MSTGQNKMDKANGTKNEGWEGERGEANGNPGVCRSKSARLG